MTTKRLRRNDELDEEGLRRELAWCKSGLRTQEEITKDVERQRNKYRDWYDALSIEHTQLKKKLGFVEEGLETFKNLHEESEKSLEGALRDLERCEEELEKSRKEVETLKKRCTQQKSNLDQKKQFTTKLRADLAEERSKNISLFTQANECEGKLSKLQQENALLHRAVALFRQMHPGT